MSSPLVAHVAAGTAFFSGAALVLLAASLGLTPRRGVRRWAPLVGVVGGLLVVVTATPLGWWWYAVAGAAFVGWLVSLAARPDRRRVRVAAAGALLGATLLGVLLELPWHVTPAVAPASARTLTVFGDSVTAGVGPGETWPALLAREHRLAVHDHARVGATAGDMAGVAAAVEIPSGLVLVEIGGNDLLGGTPVARFRRDLDALLAAVSGPGRRVVVLELPLPPFAHGYGRAQRDAAAAHGAVLVPKRVFVRVLAGDGATGDSIHLTARGQRALAAEMWGVIGGAFP